MDYEVSLKDIPPVEAMSIRFVTNMQNIAEDIPAAFHELWEHLEKHKDKGQPTGQCFALYHDAFSDPKQIDVECAFSISSLVPEGDSVKGRLVEGGQMVSTIHKGPYTSLEPAYHALLKWMEEHDYAALPLVRELFLNDPFNVSPEEILTEVLWLVKKK